MPGKALERIGLVLAHPLAQDDARQNAESALADLRADGQLAALDEDAIQTALTNGRTLDLDAVVNDLLAG